METHSETLLESSIHIDASPARVWSLVANPRNMARWSPQVVKVLMRSPAQRGASTVNLNREGLKLWPTRSKVITFEPPREFAIQIKENNAIWSFTLTPDGDGTRLVQRRDTSRGTTSLSRTLIDKVLGGQAAFNKTLLGGMQQTLERIKKDAESLPPQHR